MLYSEIKVIFENYRTEMADAAGIRSSMNSPAFKAMRENEMSFAILSAFTDQTTYQDEFLSLVDHIDTYLQIYNVVRDYEESAKILYNIIVNDETDYESENYRIIHDNYIDGILADEISCDSYILGCFSAEAIADATGWPYDLIRAAQKGEAFSEIGDAMTTEQIEKLAEIYAAADGYGHHFARYDGREYEIGTGSAGYYLFRTN